MHTGAAKFRILRTEQLFIRPWPRNSDPVHLPLHRLEVDNNQQGINGSFAPADIGDNALAAVVGINPLIPFHLMIKLPERFFVQVELVQRCCICQHTAVALIIQQQPVKLVLILPLDKLAEFPSHEQELFAGMADVIAQKQA
ncbi:hypothetical protein D3C75_687270 [compost metagenome]